MKNTPLTTASYSKLLSQIKNEIAEGLNRAEVAYEKEKIKTYWTVGKYIHNHFLQNKIQADFGKQIFKNLSKDLNIGNSLLYQMVQFYKTYPEYNPSLNLKWSHYRVLATVKDEEKRNELVKKVDNENITIRNLGTIIQDTKVERDKKEKIIITKPAKLRPIRGNLYHYKIFKNQFSNNYFVDYGFRIYKETDIKNFKGDFAKGIKNGNKFSFIPVEIQKKYIFTYVASVAKIIDADTIWVIVDLGFGAWTKQKIRFRGIDAPEKDTLEFETSRKYIIDKLKETRFLVIKSFRPDLYDRWISDIFYMPNETDENKVLENGTYLNQELLDAGIVREFDKDRNNLTL